MPREVVLSNHFMLCIKLFSEPRGTCAFNYSLNAWPIAVKGCGVLHCILCFVLRCVSDVCTACMAMVV